MRGKVKTLLFNHLSKVSIKRATSASINQRKALKKPLHSKLLDFGCGTAYTSILAANDGFDVYGFDISRGNILLNKKIKDEYNLKLLVADGEKLPFKNNALDVVYCNHVLEHIQNDRNALNEIYRVLKMGGGLILVVPSIHNLATRFKMKLRYKHPFLDAEHFREYDKDKLLALLNNSGFDVISLKMGEFLPPFGAKAFHFFVQLYKLNRFTNYLGSWFPKSALQIEVIAMKKEKRDKQ